MTYGIQRIAEPAQVNQAMQAVVRLIQYPRQAQVVSHLDVMFVGRLYQVNPATVIAIQ